MLDSLFREAVTAIDAGDVTTLERLIAEHPRLLRDRLEAPGAWLRDKVGDALEGFFKQPYLLWFVAEDPVRNGKLPENIAQVTRAIIQAAQREGVESVGEQLDYTLRLVSWSWIARECGVQIELIDALVDAGASPEENPDNALVNGNVAAAQHLVERGAALTLSTALCLERWDDVTRLAPLASDREKQFGFVLAALNGKADALRRMIDHGIDVNRPSAHLYSHGTPLHHAVCSGSLEAVKVLVNAGAKLSTKDTNENATPLGWAEYYQGEHKGDERAKRYAEIAAYLRQNGAGLFHWDSPPSGDRVAEGLRGFGPFGILAILAILAGNFVVVPLSAVLVLLWVRRSRTPWREIGYVRPESWILTVAVGIVFGIAFKLLMKAVVMPLLGADPVNQAYHHLVGNRAALPGMLYLIIAGAGFGEETVFRSWMFERFGKLFGQSAWAKVLIVLLTSVLFGLAHYAEQGLAGAEQGAIFGLVFGTIFAVTGRIWMLMVAHAAFDVTALAIIYWDLESSVARLIFK